MPFNRPTLSQLIDRVKTDIKGGLGITTVLRRSFVYVISRALAGLSHLLFGYLDWQHEQVFPDTAEIEYLERWAGIWNVERKEATFAELNITITGNEGGIIPAGTAYQRDDGLQYLLDTEITIPVSGSIVGKVICDESGENGNLLVGDAITLLSPISDVVSEALVDEIIIEAEDTESDASLRERLLTRLRLPPLGGSANDYLAWQLEVPGVTRSWVLPLYYGLGTVGCSFVEDDDDPIIPDAAKVAEVQAYIDELKPVTALVTVFAPAPAPMDLDIKISPNTTEVQDNIKNEIADLLLRDATLAGSYKAPGEVNDGSILLSKIRQAVSIAVGLDDFEIQTINGLAPANVVPSDGELVTEGVYTWQNL